MPEAELEELTRIYEERGLTRDLAEKVAFQLTEGDALSSHARDELGISEIVTAHPIQAATVSALTFATGAVVPLYDPWTQCGIVNPGTGAYNGDCGTVPNRLQFPGNIIPANQISPLSNQIAKLWDDPNQAGTVDGTNNYSKGKNAQAHAIAT